MKMKLSLYCICGASAIGTISPNEKAQKFVAAWNEAHSGDAFGVRRSRRSEERDVMKKEPRNLFKVIDELLAVIPPEEAAIRGDLEKVKTNAMYTAPECVGERWNEAAFVLERHTGHDVSVFSEWQRQLLAIFNDTQEKEVQS